MSIVPDPYACNVPSACNVADVELEPVCQEWHITSTSYIIAIVYSEQL